ncbi:MAG: phosphoenolpyruvate synthase [Burkholderiales bacterium]|nr:MAG: phosphoenolpyruvate synthase [Burkholderiales bacterium]
MNEHAWVRYFEEIGIGDRPTVGGKGASLGELLRAGIAVPPGCVVTTDAFRHFLDACDRGGAIRRRIERLQSDDLDAIAAASAEARALLGQADLPAALYDGIAAGLERICGGDTDAPMAVRSSATSEDSAEASFAGLQDTYLWIRGADAVVEHVRRCCASLYSVESVSYRRRLGMPEEGLAMAVVIQRMVDARSSGVMFTRSPTTGDRSVVTLEASWGLGSAVVSGEVTPDRFVVAKVTGEIVRRDISSKLRRHRPDPSGSGVVDEEVPEAQRTIAAVSDAEVLALAAIARRVERHYGCAQDIEWAIAEGCAPGEGVFLLQSRPETVWASREAAAVAAPRPRAVDHVFALLGGARAQPRREAR